MASGRDDVMGKVALGATGLALAAGGIAAAAMLTNRNSRSTVKKAAGKTFKRLGRVRHAFDDAGQKYQAIQHRIGMGKSKTAGRKSASKKTSKRGSNNHVAILHKIGGMDKKSSKVSKSSSRGRKKSSKS